MTFHALLATKVGKSFSTARVDLNDADLMAGAIDSVGSVGMDAVPGLAGPVLQGQVRGRTVVDVNA